MGDLTIFLNNDKISFLKEQKDKLPSASTGLMHKKTHELTFDIDKT